MRARLVALAAAALLFMLPLLPSGAALISKKNDVTIDSMDLPAALADDDSFDDLPFEQLRQALREEVERDPQRRRNSPSPKRYNLLIR